MIKVYFISGLAADRRLFKKISVPEGFEIIHLDWITPQKKESFSSYASRMAGHIAFNEPYCLLGLSMGGMIACEIVRQCRISQKPQPLLTILLSSVPINKHLPVHYRLARFLRLHQLVPVRLLKTASIMKRLFSSDNKEDKNILNEIVRDSDPVFIRWAMAAVLNWQNEDIPAPLCHIHGSRDRILPFSSTRPTHTIKDGGHLMVMTRAAEINGIIREALLKYGA